MFFIVENNKFGYNIYLDFKLKPIAKKMYFCRFVNFHELWK